MKYFISDTHFGHKRILEFERGNKFKTIEEHDNFIMSVIKERVKKDDILYHLGDFGFGIKYHCDNDEYFKKIINEYKNLPCRKIIVIGNHDKANEIESLGIFDEIHRVPIFITNRILLSHEPEMVSPYVLNIHGHLHNSHLDSENHLNVNIYETKYSLVSEKAINKKLGKLEDRNEKFLFEWYKDLYVFDNKADDRVIDENGKIDVKATIDLLDKQRKEVEIDNKTLKLKKIALKENKSLYLEDDGDYYIGEWNKEEKAESINRVNIKIIENEKKDFIEDYERWDRCWVNGKRLSRLFKKASNDEKYLFVKIE